MSKCETMNHRDYTNPSSSRQEGTSEVAVSRRSFLGGTLKTGALLGLAGGTLAATSSMTGCSSEEEIDPLTVSSENVSSFDSLEELETPDDMFEQVASWEMPYGTVVFSNSADMAVCLVPMDSASPLTNVYTLDLLSGDRTCVLDEAMGTDDGFEIYDVRGTEDGLCWVEANIFTRDWRVYASPLSDDGELSNIQMLDSGDGEWEMPSVAVSGGYAFWQVRPRTDGSHTLENSLLKKAAFNSTSSQVIFESEGRFCTPIYPLEDELVITPRRDNELVHYEMTLINAQSNAVEDTLCLQSGMKPLEAGYGTNGFFFSFEAIYDYGDGISNLGTYTPFTSVVNGDYQNCQWFAFARTPTAAPCWCGDYFLIKSTTAVVGFDFGGTRYCILDVPEGADDYGSYLATTGTPSRFVTYTNVDSNPIVGEARNVCDIQVWQRA